MCWKMDVISRVKDHRLNKKEVIKKKKKKESFSTIKKSTSNSCFVAHLFSLDLLSDDESNIEIKPLVPPLMDVIVFYDRVYFPQICNMKTDAIKTKDITKTGTGPLHEIQ